MGLRHLHRLIESTHAQELCGAVCLKDDSGQRVARNGGVGPKACDHLIGVAGIRIPRIQSISEVLRDGLRQGREGGGRRRRVIAGEGRSRHERRRPDRRPVMPVATDVQHGPVEGAVHVEVRGMHRS